LSSELYINSGPKGDRIALLQNKRLVEFHVENNANSFTVGDIFLGHVTKIVPGLNATFVDVGYEKDAFLHYHDLGPQIKSLSKYVKMVQNGGQGLTHKLQGFKLESDIDKMGKITQVFTKDQNILVQVVKEPISTKGPRLSCEISIAGRFLVLVPFSNSISISKKIAEKDERQRLQRLIQSIKPEGFGVIIRTVAQHKEVAELDKDLKSLLTKWEDGFNALKTARPKDKIIGEMNRANSILRDLLNESFDAIVVDSKEIYEEIKTYIKSIAPDKERILKLHSNKTKIFEEYGVEKQIKAAFGKTVTLPNGGYLIIEHTEALHVIDVNSGNKSNAESDQEDTALAVNLDACKEIARQLKLRDLGGIIVVDFIDMKNQDNRNFLYAKMKEEMVTDRSKFTVLPLSKFGLMQVTRQRVRPQLDISNLETCPTCNGTGTIQATINIPDQIEQHLDLLFTKQNEKNVLVSLHPLLYDHFTKGLISKRVKWYFKYKKWVQLIKDSAFGLTEYSFINDRGEEIEMK